MIHIIWTIVGTETAVSYPQEKQYIMPPNNMIVHFNTQVLWMIPHTYTVLMYLHIM